jgi:hypothetical protein
VQVFITQRVIAVDIFVQRVIERARRRLAVKRRGRAVPMDLDEVEIPSPAVDDDQFLAINEALEKFTAVDPRQTELVKLRYFVGMSFKEASAALGIAVSIANQWWAYCPRLAGGEDRNAQVGRLRIFPNEACVAPLLFIEWRKPGSRPACASSRGNVLNRLAISRFRC